MRAAPVRGVARASRILIIRWTLVMTARRGARRWTMPVYEFFCRRCQKPFVEVMHVSEHDSNVAECPDCHQKDEVEKRLSTFTAVTSRKSTAM
jgi:putative FmdB family regulatory protein